MKTEFKEFYEVLKENLNSYEEEYESFVDYGPELFKLLTNILDERKANSEVRLKVSSAIAYFVAPYDIIPEQIYGPFGYIDDIYLAVYVLEDIKNDLGYGILENLWDANGTLDDVLEECLEKSSTILGEKVVDIIKYIGLDYFDNKRN